MRTYNGRSMRKPPCTRSSNKQAAIEGSRRNRHLRCHLTRPTELGAISISKFHGPSTTLSFAKKGAVWFHLLHKSASFRLTFLLIQPRKLRQIRLSTSARHSKKEKKKEVIVMSSDVDSPPPKKKINPHNTRDLFLCSTRLYVCACLVAKRQIRRHINISIFFP